MENIHEKLQYIQTNLKAPKGQFNAFGKYKYRSCEDIVEGVKPLLSECKCYLTMNDDIVLIGDRYYIKATVTIADGKDKIEVSAMAREEESKKGMDGAQITGTSSSYARKYALNGMFAIDDTKDADTVAPKDNTPIKSEYKFGFGDDLDWVSETTISDMIEYIKKGQRTAVISRFPKYRWSNNNKQKIIDALK